MPQINPYCQNNIHNIVQLSMILTKLNQKFYFRTLIFVTVITLVMSIPLLWILFETCFIGTDLQDVGPADFLIYALYLSVLCMYEFITLMSYGSEANDMDFKIKEYLMKISSECDVARLMSKNDMVYKKDDKLYIFKKSLEDSNFYCLNDKSIHSNLDAFEPINDIILDAQDNLKCEIDSNIDKIDYKLENQ